MSLTQTVETSKTQAIPAPFPNVKGGRTRVGWVSGPSASPLNSRRYTGSPFPSRARTRATHEIVNPL